MMNEIVCNFCKKSFNKHLIYECGICNKNFCKSHIIDDGNYIDYTCVECSKTNMYSHQKFENNLYSNKFLLVHDDIFGRSFKNIDKIIEFVQKEIKNLKYNIDIISIDHNGNINVFLLTIFSEMPLKNLDYLLEHNRIDLTHFDDIYYYSCIPVDFNIVAINK